MQQATAPKLYELTDVYTDLASRHYAILGEIEEAEGAITEKQEKLLDEIRGELEKILDTADKKILNIARLCIQRSVEIAAIKGEEDRIAEIGKGLAARRKRLERSNEFFEGYVLQAMRMIGARELSDDRNKARISESKATEIIEPAVVPDEYIRQVVVKMPDTDERGLKSRILIIGLLKQHSILFEREVDKTQAKKDIDKEGKIIPGLTMKINQKVKFS